MKPAQKRVLVQFLQIGFRVSQRKACRAIGVWPSACRYRSQARDQTRCGCAVGSWPRPECDRATGGCTSFCRPAAARPAAARGVAGQREADLSPLPVGRSVAAPEVPQEARERAAGGPAGGTSQGAVEHGFRLGQPGRGRRFGALTLGDNVSKVSPAIEAAPAFAGGHVVEVLERLVVSHELPHKISVDNGPEFISRALDAWRIGTASASSSVVRGSRRTTRSSSRSTGTSGRTAWGPTPVPVLGGGKGGDRSLAVRVQHAPPS